jgi:hypothetical protein
MSNAIIRPRIRRVLDRMKFITPPRSEAEYQALLARAGVREPRNGRPRGGARTPTSLCTFRLDDPVKDVVRRIAARKRTSFGALTRRIMTEYALSHSA